MIYKLEIYYKDGNKYEKIKRNTDIQVSYNENGKFHQIVFGGETFIIDDDNVISFELKNIGL